MRKMYLAIVVVSLSIMIGCQQKKSETSTTTENQQAEQQQAQPAPEQSPAQPPPETAPAAPQKQKAATPEPSMLPAQSAAVNNPAPPPPPPKPIVIPAGTAVTVRLDQAISTKTAKQGDTFTATVAEPIVVDGKTVVPARSSASGVVTESKSPGKFKGEGVLTLQLAKMTVQGVAYPLQAEASTSTEKGKGKRSTAMIGGGAAGGALIGGLAGGGKGAAIGALVGGGAGTAGAAMTGNKELEVPAETVVSFRLLQPVTLKR